MRGDYPLHDCSLKTGCCQPGSELCRFQFIDIGRGFPPVGGLLLPAGILLAELPVGKLGKNSAIRLFEKRPAVKKICSLHDGPGFSVHGLSQREHIRFYTAGFADPLRFHNGKEAVFLRESVAFHRRSTSVPKILPWHTNKILVKCDQPPKKPCSSSFCCDLPGRNSC